MLAVSAALVAAGTLVLSPVVAPAAAPLVLKDVVERVQKRYDTAADFKARFSQTLTNVTYNRKTTSSGEVLLKKPGRMRWNYDKPDKKMYLADGQILWLYEPEDKQAFKQDLKGSQLPAALAFLTGKGKLTDEFDVTLAGADKDKGYVLALRPKQPQTQYKSITFVVDPDTFHVRESILIDTLGNSNAMVFSDVVVNSKVPEATFRWLPPAGVRVIDAAKLGR